MKLFTPYLVAVLIVTSPFSAAWADDYRRLVTTTLLSVEENTVRGNPEGANDFLWVQKTSPKNIELSFNLSELPPGLAEADFEHCTLRLVAKNILFQPSGNTQNTGGTRIRLKGRVKDTGSDFIVALSTLSATKKPVALNQDTSNEFRQAIYKAYSSGEKEIALTLVTDSSRAGGLFYSARNNESSPSNIPRLVITYRQQAPAQHDTLSWSQHQHDPEHTGRGAWIPFTNPKGFTLQEIPISNGSIAGYLLIYRGNMYLVKKNKQNNILVALDFKGKALWEKSIGTGTVQRSPAISEQGIIYIVTENKISAFNLKKRGEVFASYTLVREDKLTLKLSNFTDLTVGHDGSLFLALKENNVNYIYGFTPNLKPFIKSNALGKGNDNISSVTVSADGSSIFAQIPEGAVVVDITDPASQQIFPLEENNAKPWGNYYTPVAGPEGGVMIFSDFAGDPNEGNIWGYAASKKIWHQKGTTPSQPVLGSNEFVSFIQNSALQRHKYNAIGSGETPVGSDLNTTSNLVMDGANNIYFWNNGDLRGYNKDGGELFLPESFVNKGPEENLRLMLSPDGTLWANNNHGTVLYAFKPTYPTPDLSVRQDDIKDRTFYRANDNLLIEGLTLDESTQVVFQAQKSISFAKGFKVKKGAGLLCRTGF